MNNGTLEQTNYGLTLFVAEHNLTNLALDQARIAEIGRHLIFDPDSLNTYHYDGWKPIHHDLLVLSAAVEFADRSSRRRPSQWSREFWITLPVLEPAIWNQKAVQNSLCSTLRFLTGDHWIFSFAPWKGAISSSRQRSLPFGRSKEFVIAYSDGMDSRCVSGLYDAGEKAVRVRIAKNRQQPRIGDRPFDQMPFRVKVPHAGEVSNRSRGFKFACTTAIAAHLCGLERIIVPESGQGALGPVLNSIHGVYPDYRNHPAYFRRMECFIKALLNYPVKYEQPRLWSTKGETVTAYLQSTARPHSDLLETRSCWQQRWNARINGRIRQCGLCAACLLRRVSMLAACVEEPPEAYVLSDLTVPHFREAIPERGHLRLSKTMLEYGIVGTRHLEQLAGMANRPDDDLRVQAFDLACAIGTSEIHALGNLRRLLDAHRSEWRAFVAAQGRTSFLRSWIEGVPHG